MNTPILIQKLLMAFCLLGTATLFALLLAYCFRHHLRRLNERWRALNPATRCLLILFVTAFVLYGGTKSPTNDPPIDIEGDVSAPTNAPPEIVDNAPAPTNAPPPLLLSACCSTLVMSAPPQLTNQPTNQLTNWSLRGAYSDWHHIDFPSSFAFPHGTNLLTSITLFAYGEIRESLHQLTTNNQQLTTLPTAVSLSPGESSVTYGLTPSNSFLIAWQNACVNRDATNRVDASIELFRNGAMATTVIPLSASTPPTYTYIPTPLPEGFVGEGQDTNWIASALSPQDASLVAEKGYDDWLLDDYVGINEQNGRYMVSVTVHSLPDDGTPCYLVCGPYKVVVKQAGTYSFPLEVFTEYRARTYPIRLPLSISYDDGYRSDDENEMSPLMNTPSLLGAAPVPDYYLICMTPHVYVVPSHIPLEQAVNARIALWCNVPSGQWSYHGSLLNDLELNFGIPSYAEIRTAAVAQRVVLLMHYAGHECEGVIYIDPPPGYSWPTNSWYY